MCDVFANRGEYSEWKARSVKLENWQRTPRQEFSPELVQWRESLSPRRKLDFQKKKTEVQAAAGWLLQWDYGTSECVNSERACLQLHQQRLFVIKLLPLQIHSQLS